MKKFAAIYLLLFVAASVFFVACEEEPPFINFEKPNTTLDTTYVNPTPSAPQQKQVVLEDVTGVQCVNCPDAAAIAKALQVANPGKVNVIAIHPLDVLKNFTDPINKPPYVSRQNFTTEVGAIICRDILGVPNALPKGAVDRIKFPDKTDLLIDRTDWTKKVEQELLIPPTVNISLQNDISAPANEIIITAKVEYTEAATDTNYITLVIVEDSIIDVQEYIDYSGPIPAPAYNDNYKHMHIMRATITGATGDLLNKPNAPLVAGRIFEKRYRYTIPSTTWVKKNLHVIGFVHRNGATKNILQSAHVSVGQ